MDIRVKDNKGVFKDSESNGIISTPDSREYKEHMFRSNINKDIMMIKQDILELKEMIRGMS
jgi:hypothetical protein